VLKPKKRERERRKEKEKRRNRKHGHKTRAGVFLKVYIITYVYCPLLLRCKRLTFYDTLVITEFTCKWFTFLY
jgi:hypothetical protein